MQHFTWKHRKRRDEIIAALWTGVGLIVLGAILAGLVVLAVEKALPQMGY